jgi:transposase InsO family protein
LPDFLRYYNEDRFHMGINGLTPMQRLAGHQ